MKPFFIKYICLALVLALTGCTKYLDIKPKGRDIPETFKHFEGMFNSTYLVSFSYFQINDNGSSTLLQSEVYFPYMTDELECSESSFKNFGRTSLEAYNWNGKLFNEDDYSAEWGTLYSQIYTMNVIINGVPNATDASDAQKKAVEAEARVRRAYNYLMLGEFFGKPYNQATAATDLSVPIVTKADVAVTDFERATVKQVYDFIIPEMENWIKYLPETCTLNLRLSQPAGYTLLGRAYLCMGNYEKALEALKNAYTALGKSSQTVVGLFDYNKTMKEWGYNPDKPWAFASSGSVPLPNRTAYIESIYTLMASVGSMTFYFSEPTAFIKDSYMAKFGATDLRRNFFSKKNYTGVIEWPYYRKIQHTAITVAAGVPDLYLMLAECEARVGSEAEARRLLVEFRKNRMPEADAPVPATVVSKEDLIRFVVEERIREFMGSGYRWFDIRRLWNDPLFQQMKANYTHSNGAGQTYTLTEDRLVYQIPPKVMLYNKQWINNN